MRFCAKPVLLAGIHINRLFFGRSCGHRCWQICNVRKCSKDHALSGVVGGRQPPAAGSPDKTGLLRGRQPHQPPPLALDRDGRLFAGSTQKQKNFALAEAVGEGSPHGRQLCSKWNQTIRFISTVCMGETRMHTVFLYAHGKNGADFCRRGMMPPCRKERSAVSGRRVLALYGVMLTCFFVVVCRLYWLAQNQTYAARARAQSQVTLALPAPRGGFYD